MYIKLTLFLLIMGMFLLVHPVEASSTPFHACAQETGNKLLFAFNDTVAHDLLKLVEYTTSNVVTSGKISDLNVYRNSSYSFILKADLGDFNVGDVYEVALERAGAGISTTFIIRNTSGTLSIESGSSSVLVNDGALCSMPLNSTSTITTGPTAPTLLQADSPTPTTIRLQWVDNSTDETGFSYRIATTPNLNTVTDRTLLAGSRTTGARTATIAVSAGTPYYITVAAYYVANPTTAYYSYTGIVHVTTAASGSGGGGGTGGGPRAGCTTSLISTGLGAVPTEPACLVEWLIARAIQIVGGLGFMRLLLGAFKLLTSSGSPEGMEEAKELITSALVGMLFVVFATIILQIVGVDILGIPGFGRNLNNLITPS